MQICNKISMSTTVQDLKKNESIYFVTKVGTNFAINMSDFNLVKITIIVANKISKLKSADSTFRKLIKHYYVIIKVTRNNKIYKNLKNE